MLAVDLLPRLRGVRENGGSWTACCPAHEDRSPSLSVKQDRDRVLLHCFGGCSPEAVVSALGLTLADLFTDKRPAPVAIPPAPDAHPQLGKPDHVYRYSETFRVCRWDARDGRGKQVRPLSFAGGVWSWRAPDGARPLYGLDLLKARPGARVLIVEGEKCADAAQGALGDTWCVVTWSGGAAAVTKTDYAPLYGRDVVLWPDNDAAGRGAMEQLAGLLTKARSVRLVQVGDADERPAGWDLADAIGDGATGEEVAALITEWGRPWDGSAATVDPGPSVAEADGVRVFVPERDRPIARPKDILSLSGQSLLTPGNVAVLVAHYGTGKTAVCSAILAGALSPSADTFGLTVATSAAVYIGTEGSEYDTDLFYRRVLARAGVNSLGSSFIARLTGGTPAARREAVRRVLDEHPAELVVLDLASDFVPSVNDEETCVEYVGWLLALAEDNRTGILAVLHDNVAAQDGRARGWLGSELCRRAAGVLTIKRGPDDTRCLTTDFAFGKARHGAPASSYFRWDSDAARFVSCDAPAAKPAASEKYAEIAEKVGTGGVTYSTLLALVGGTPDAARGKIRRMRERGVLDKAEDGLWYAKK